jgi:hypothetical protein
MSVIIRQTTDTTKPMYVMYVKASLSAWGGGLSALTSSNTANPVR